MRFILLGNYPPDGQESMERFAQMLHSGLHEAGVAAEIWRPVPVVGGRIGSTVAGLGKWLGYVDKWLIFPVILRWRVWRRGLGGAEVRFHVCDHSNAPYLGHLDSRWAGITCHDVLAIRGSRGHTDAYAPASRFGRILQQWIYKHLHRAERLATVSELTMQQLLVLAGPDPVPRPASWRVIPNAFNAHFRPMEAAERAAVLHRAGLALPPLFLLHVGSGAVRKNRGMLLEMVHALGSRWPGSICFAGEAPDEALLARAAALGLRERVVAVVKPDHDTLVALYGACEAFVFPSFSEGFGWPVIEAQACGAPVIASTVEPMPEVSGGAALHADPTDPAAFAAALLALQEPGARQALVQRGLLHSQQFAPARMVQAYLQLYDLVPTPTHAHAA